jgi:Kdo2-lipid IVA lauroyltransferase/acyltransferase
MLIRELKGQIEYQNTYKYRTISMMVTLLRLIGRWPLPWLHRTGALLGWIVYIASPVYASRMRANLAQSGIYSDARERERALREAIVETGKGVMEIAKIWFDDETRVANLVECANWEVVETAFGEGRGIIFLTPHLGCFEVAALYVAQRMPLTALYRPPRQRWLEPLMLRGRNRGQARLAPATLRGVRLLYKALQRGECVGLLPDQAPQTGEGVWAEFFGRPAYTMTLVRRLQKQTGAAVVFAFAERLQAARGFVLRFERYRGGELDERALNRAVEDLIRIKPAQYLWSYNRYKVPKGAPPPAATEN